MENRETRLASSGSSTRSIDSRSSRVKELLGRGRVASGGSGPAGAVGGLGNTNSTNLPQRTTATLLSSSSSSSSATGNPSPLTTSAGFPPASPRTAAAAAASSADSNFTSNHLHSHGHPGRKLASATSGAGSSVRTGIPASTTASRSRAATLSSTPKSAAPPPHTPLPPPLPSTPLARPASICIVPRPPPAPTPYRHRRTSSSSSVTSSSSRRVAVPLQLQLQLQRPQLNRSATVPSRHNIVTAVHVDSKEDSRVSIGNTIIPTTTTTTSNSNSISGATRTEKRLSGRANGNNSSSNNNSTVPTSSTGLTPTNAVASANAVSSALAATSSKPARHPPPHQPHRPQPSRNSRHTTPATTTTPTPTTTTSSVTHPPSEPTPVPLHPITSPKSAAPQSLLPTPKNTIATPAAASGSDNHRDNRFNFHNNNTNTNTTPNSRPSSSFASTRSHSPTPPKKRAPARFSSNGVETSAGPPPSLAFRKRFTMDNRGHYTVPSTPSRAYNRDQGSSSASSNTISARTPSRTGTAQGHRDISRTTSAMKRRQSFSSFDDEEEDEDDDEYGEKDRTIRGLEDLRDAHAPVVQNTEDVFLKLARSNSTSSRAADRLERRRARLSQYRNSMPADVTQSSPAHRRETADFNSSPPQVDEEVWRRARHMSSPPPGDYRARRMSQTSDHEERPSITPRPTFNAPRPQSVLRRDNSHGHARSFSVVESSPRTSFNSRPLTRLGASPLIDDKLAPPQVDEREYAASIAGVGSGGRSADSASTASTTAASSVWDELDDLKSRIRRLEVTGRMPASGAGNASNSSGDRPRTATTTVTTVSSSPRTNAAAGISPINSTFGGSNPSSTNNTTTSHPLLHTALAKSKAVMPPDVYRHLELAAKDALDMANTVGAPGSGAPTVAGVDRNVRRKADSVCRSLTELCLALSENRHTIAPPPQIPFIQAQFVQTRPASRGVGAESVYGGRNRDSFDGRESVLSQRLPSRTIGRFAERKGSLASLNVSAGYSPRSDPAPSPGIRHRSSLMLKEGFSESDRFRAPSRAGTEMGGLQRVPSNRHSMPREYTTNDVQSTLAPRRSSMVPSIQSSPLASSKRFLSSLGDSASRSQEFTMTGGPINERLASAMNSQDPESSVARFRNGTLNRAPSNRRLAARPLREGGMEIDRTIAIRRAEAATERLLRR